MSVSKLVNKKFHSPINLCLPQTIQETLERQTQVLSTGSDRINFNQLAKSTNLKNSSVLRMLKEEEKRKKAKISGLKRVAWPPPSEGEDYLNYIEQCPEQKQDQELPMHYYQSHSTSTDFESPSLIITLRSEPPISQQSLPVYQTQPAVTNSKSGNMFGNLKWPPAPMKKQTKTENRTRIELTKGPICRPQRINKDYTGFFAQHANRKNYPGYRAPPGTQHFTSVYHQ